MTNLDLLVPSCRNLLGALSAWLDKAQADGQGRADALLAARLAPDMYPLATQIRFACVQVHEATARLQGRDLPDAVTTLLDEGRGAGAHPGTMAAARARIAEAVALLDGLNPDVLDDEPARPIAHALPNGMVFDLTADQYVRDWVMPQFYFHVMIAYAILRQNGVELGKADYVAHMFAHLRPGTMPGQ